MTQSEPCLCSGVVNMVYSGQHAVKLLTGPGPGGRGR